MPGKKKEGAHVLQTLNQNSHLMILEYGQEVGVLPWEYTKKTTKSF